MSRRPDSREMLRTAVDCGPAWVMVPAWPDEATARRFALADTLRASASRIVGGADPGEELATLRAAITAWGAGL